MSINIAIGFVTGRKHFQHVLTTHVNNWLEHGLIVDKKIRLHLMVAYDLKYAKTMPGDYKNIHPDLADLIESISFYGKQTIENEKESIVSEGILTQQNADLIFGEGYAKKRNAVVYFAIKNKMDRLIFLDDDEYPIAVMKNNFGNLVWMGQSVVGTHLKYSNDADITHGHHCGYISPIPLMPFNDMLTEADFKMYVEAISNEIVSWDVVQKNILQNQGVTYANPDIINEERLTEVQEISGMKFISGANLCFNLKNCATKIPPFYNPPGARGEDTFMSTALSDMKVLKVPVYTFHDGFLNYKQILRGNLPITLQPVNSNSPSVVRRFINASIGWIRYKPLMLYITRRNEYDELINGVKQNLELSIPKFCQYFQTEQFQQILIELEQYHKNVRRHFNAFEATKSAWSELIKKTGAKSNLSGIQE